MYVRILILHINLFAFMFAFGIRAGQSSRATEAHLDRVASHAARVAAERHRPHAA